MDAIAYSPFILGPVGYGVECATPDAQIGDVALGVWTTNAPSHGTFTPGIMGCSYEIDTNAEEDAFSFVIRHCEGSVFTLDFDFDGAHPDCSGELFLNITEYHPDGIKVTMVENPSGYSITLQTAANPCGNKIVVDWSCGTTVGTPPPP